jgi:hypothetical protein
MKGSGRLWLGLPSLIRWRRTGIPSNAAFCPLGIQLCRDEQSIGIDFGNDIESAIDL